MTQPTEQQARAALDNYLSQYRQAKRNELLDAYRAAVLREAADAIDAETQTFKADGILEPDKFRPCRDASAQLRRIARSQP